MDPASLTFSVIDITAAALESIQILVQTIDDVKGAPDVIKTVSTDLNVIRHVLRSLLEAEQDNSSQILFSEQIRDAVRNCERVCDTFRLQVEHWMERSMQDKTFWDWRWKVGLLGLERIKAFRGQLSDCKHTLSVALSTATIIATTHQEGLMKEMKDMMLKQNEVVMQRQIAQAGNETREIELTIQKLLAANDNALVTKDPQLEELEKSKQEVLYELEAQKAANQTFVRMCEEALSQTVHQRTGQTIKDVRGTNNSTALAGFINTDGDEHEIEQVISDKKIETSANRPKDLAQALEHRVFTTVRELLEFEFDEVAQGEYEWLHELIDVGYDPSDIAELLIKEAEDAPWIYLDSQDEWIQSPESKGSTVIAQDSQETAFLSSPWTSKRHDLKVLIQRLCGLGGVAPISRFLEDWNGEIVFKKNYSISYISYTISSEDGDASNVSGVVSRLSRVLKNFCAAATALQNAHLCPPRFTIARTHVLPTVSTPGKVEIERVDIALAVELSAEFERLSSILSDTPDLTQSLEISREILRPLLSHGSTLPSDILTTDESLHVCCLAAQFLCVGLVSFCQGHAGPIESVLTNRTQERSVLLGNRTLNKGISHIHPYITVCLSKLSCLGKMIGGPLITFCMSRKWLEEDAEMHDVVQGALLNDQVTKLSQIVIEDISVEEREYHVEATPDDILDTWGPGQLISSDSNKSLPRAIHVGGGFIYPTNGVGNEFHWEAGVEPSELSQSSFDRESKITVGASVTVNTEPCSFPWEDCRSQWTLEVMGTVSEQWEADQRQIAIQGGPSNFVVQATLGWKKIPAKLLKHIVLQQEPSHMMDFLKCYVGVQVSCCTGVARRRTLDEVLKDLIPVSASEVVSDQWTTWKIDYKTALDTLETGDVRKWLNRLKILSVEAHGEFLVIILKILNTLEQTGFTSNGENIRIAWPRKDDSSRGIVISCKNIPRWAKILQDSTAVVTFAYMTPVCLLSPESPCQQERRVNIKIPKCLGTAVIRHRNRMDRGPLILGPLELEDKKSYHIWNTKEYLVMKADTSRSERRLIVSASGMPRPMAKFQFLGNLFKEKCVIRERYHSVDNAVDVLISDKE